MSTILEERQVFPPPKTSPKGAIRVVKQRIEHDGVRRTQYIWKRPNFVMVVPVGPTLSENKTVWAKLEHKFAVDEELLTFAAGAIKPDEVPTIAAARELKEEFALAFSSLELLGTFRVSPDKSTEAQYIFAALGCQPIPGLEPEKGEIFQFPARSLDILNHPKMTISLCRLAFFETWKKLIFSKDLH